MTETDSWILFSSSMSVGEVHVRARHIVALVQAMWLALVPVWLALAPVTAASGTANCSEGGPINRWQGQQSATSAQRHGAQAIFEGQVLVQCTNPGFVEISGSFVFSNVVATVNAGANDIVQIGAGNCRAPNCVGGMAYYTGWGRTPSTPGCGSMTNVLPLANWVGTWGGGDRVYKVQHVSNYWQLLVGNTQYYAVPEIAICWTPQSSVWFGESWDFGDQIGGTAANKLSITQASYMTAENGAFVATSFTSANPCNYRASSFPFNCDVTGARSLDIWTAR